MATLIVLSLVLLTAGLLVFWRAILRGPQDLSKVHSSGMHRRKRRISL